MNFDIFYVYTDASYSKSYDFAIIGYILFYGTQDHETTPALEKQICLQKIDAKNNIRSEIKAAITGLSSCPKGGSVQLFSDCKAVCDLPSRRDKLEKNNFMSQNKGERLKNSDLYLKFYSISDQMQLDLQWVKGHSPNKNKNKIQKNFSYLDKQVRKRLRSEIAKANDTNNKKDKL